MKLAEVATDVTTTSPEQRRFALEIGQQLDAEGIDYTSRTSTITNMNDHKVTRVILDFQDNMSLIIHADLSMVMTTNGKDGSWITRGNEMVQDIKRYMRNRSAK